ncbi:TIGR01440 family protein [Lihuaxuella thermophila]|nr:TIGR01440 family protein [Lihuaxuella thermophila]
MKSVIEELLAEMPLSDKHVLVFGVSTSEVAGKRIGTSGSDRIASALFEAIIQVQRGHGFHLAFQCCEHLNRALVVERETAEKFGWPEVSAVPVPQAGGAMAAYAFRHLKDAVLVEQIQADAGIDIGDTLIGMHLKPVAVPVRPVQKKVGEAHVTMAKTRPKLIGGARAVYEIYLS